MIPDELQTLIERRNWLAARIKAKESVGWETTYDEREHRALRWAVESLTSNLRELEGERDARYKLEVALTGKDKAMGVLFERLSAAGVDCSDIIS